jgi:hypothetical protein
MKFPEPMIPNFSAEATAKQDVVHHLNSLIADNASGGILQSMPKPPLSRPTSPMHDQPEEETHPRQGGGLPNLFGAERHR